MEKKLTPYRAGGCAPLGARRDQQVVHAEPTAIRGGSFSEVLQVAGGAGSVIGFIGARMLNAPISVTWLYGKFSN
jgi:hypothetical protein